MPRDNSEKLKRFNISGIPLIKSVSEMLTLKSIFKKYIPSYSNETVSPACTLLFLIWNITLEIEDFPIVFMHRDLNHEHPYSWLCFIYNKIVRSPFWEDWKRIISEKELREVVMYKRPKDLQDFYDAAGLKTPYHESQPNLPIVGRKNPQDSIRWSDLDAVLENLFKGLFGALKKAGVLPEDFPRYPNIKYSTDGDYLSNWADYAKSNPKQGL